MESLVVWARVRAPMSWRMSSGLSVEGLEAGAMPPLERRLRLCDISVRSESVDASRDFVGVVILGCARAWLREWLLWWWGLMVG